jgi:tripartite-type tricarboxylate transporter receptor subunit TctC
LREEIVIKIRHAKQLILHIATVLPVILGAATAGDAQAYPTRPITVVIPFAGGSASDVVTRIMVERMSKAMAQPFVIEKRPGAGGNVGTAIAAKAAPDGYTLLGASSGPIAENVALYRNLPYDPVRDFEIISPFATFNIVIVASAKLPVTTLAQLASHLCGG